MALIKTIVISGVSTLSKIVSGILILKILAIYLGPAGVGVAGQFLGFAALLVALAGGGIELGIIKYVAEYDDSVSEFRGFVFSALMLSLTVSIVIAVFGIIFQKQLALLVLQDEGYANLFFWLSCSLILVSLHQLLYSILSGLRKIKPVMMIMVSSSVINLLLSWVLTVKFGVQGALYAIILSQAVLLGISLIYTWREVWFRYLFSANFNWGYIYDLKRYSLMRVVQMLVIPLSQVIVRSDISMLYGWHIVGYWQGVLRISDAILLFAQVFITTYYLPRLSSLSGLSDVRTEIRNVFIVLMPLIVCLLLGIYLFRDTVILLIYSPNFLPARDLFLYQFIGDIFRIAGLLFSYVFIAKAQIKMYTSCELLLGILFISLSHMLARRYGVIGVTYAFALSYFTYFLVVMYNSLRFTRHSGGRVLIPA